MRRSRGFTLFEVLIAVAVMAIVMTVIYRSYWLCTKNVAQAQEHSDLYQSARLALRRLSDDLMCAYVPLSTEEGEGRLPERAAPPAEEGGDEEAAGGAPTGFRGYDGGSGEQARDVLEFVSLANLSRRAAARYEPCELQYAVEDAGTGVGRLMRNSTTGSGEAESVELAPNVKGLDVRYLNAEGTPADGWDSAASGQLPSVVEITLYLARDEESEPVVFTTAVAIPLAWEREALGRGVSELAAAEKEKAEARAKGKEEAEGEEGQEEGPEGAKGEKPEGGPQPGGDDDEDFDEE